MPILFPDAVQWARSNFTGVALGLDCRRERLIYSAARLALHPGASLPSLFNPKDLRCFYSLLHRKEASHQALLAGHFALTKQAMQGPDVILVVHDTTELDFTSHKALHCHLGPIGNGKGFGLLQHNSLAVRATDGWLLGLAHQQLVARQPVPFGESRSQGNRRERESALWPHGFEGVGRAPEGCCWVDVCDRGGDIFEALYVSLEMGHHALIRVCQDRCIWWQTDDGGQQTGYLLQVARGLSGQVENVVSISQKGGRPARQAVVKLAAEPVWIEPPKQMPKRKQYKKIGVWVVRIWEEKPPEGEEALEWVLLSSMPTRTEEELLLRRDWYALRWPVAEDYHQAEKSGCGEEKIRFQDQGALRAMLAVLSAVAVRVVQLRQAGRACPEEAAERMATPLEIALVQQALAVQPQPWTVTQFVHGVAKLGGFLGRKCDGEPGWKTMWRGYERLQTMMEGIHLAEQIRQRQQQDPSTH
jgi:Transposase Tn5 dimerisation domain